MSEWAIRSQLRARAAEYYRPEELADQLLATLERMETEADAAPKCTIYRRRLGLLCAAEFRGFKNPGHVENAITSWLASYFPNAETQTRGANDNRIPDIVFSYKRDQHGEDVLVLLEAKPIWHRWITDGAKVYPGVVTDEFGRSSGGVDTVKNIQQLCSDRDKLLRTYTDPRDRHLLFALVFQRPGEWDERVIEAIGPAWSVRIGHIADHCNPPGDNIGLTAMIFWPSAQGGAPK